MGRQVKYYNHLTPELGDISGLSPRRAQVLELVARGYTSKDIADELGIGEDCAKAHIDHLRNQFCAMNRTELVYQACAHGVLKSSGKRAAFCLLRSLSARIKPAPTSPIEYQFHWAQARLPSIPHASSAQPAVEPLFSDTAHGNYDYLDIPTARRREIDRMVANCESREADRLRAYVEKATRRFYEDQAA